MRSLLEVRFAERLPNGAWEYESWRVGSERGDRWYWPDFTLRDCRVAHHDDADALYRGSAAVEVKPTWGMAVEDERRVLSVLAAGLDVPVIVVVPGLRPYNALAWLPWAYHILDGDRFYQRWKGTLGPSRSRDAATELVVAGWC